MNIIDLHCDVLEKLTRFEDASFKNDPRIRANLENLKRGKVTVQVFAIFIDPSIPPQNRFLEAARQVEAFYTKVLSEPEMVHITDWDQLSELHEGQIGAVLSLEGCDCIGDDLDKLKLLLNAGVKLVGLTWNFENAVAYGAGENPLKGLKPFAKDVINLLNERDVIVDVAHLNEQGFYEVLPQAKHLIASHCNARAICDHPRNLSEQQLKRLVQHGGRVHVVFYPPFIEKDSNSTTIVKLVDHIQYLSQVVGVDHIGFGSDFDGMDPLAVNGLSTAAEYQNLIQLLLKSFTKEEVYTMAFGGFFKYVNGKRKNN